MSNETFKAYMKAADSWKGHTVSRRIARSRVLRDCGRPRGIKITSFTRIYTKPKFNFKKLFGIKDSRNYHTFTNPYQTYSSQNYELH